MQALRQQLVEMGIGAVVVLAVIGIDRRLVLGVHWMAPWKTGFSLGVPFDCSVTFAGRWRDIPVPQPRRVLEQILCGRSQGRRTRLALDGCVPLRVATVTELPRLCHPRVTVRSHTAWQSTRGESDARTADPHPADRARCAARGPGDPPSNRRAPPRHPRRCSWAGRATRTKCARRSACAMRCSPARWAPGWTPALPGHDIDLFDDYCEHLLVRDAATGDVIGTYRVLTPAQARRVGSTYSDTEFDLTRLRTPARRGWSNWAAAACIREHRHGGVILALWGALFEFMVRNELDTMIGCASIPMLHNGVVSGDAAASIWRQLERTHLAPIELPGAPAAAAAGGAARCLAAGGAARADQGLPAAGRQGARRAGVGPGLQHRRPADADAHRATCRRATASTSSGTEHRMRAAFDAFGSCCRRQCLRRQDRPTRTTGPRVRACAPSSSPTSTWARRAARPAPCWTS